MRRRIAPVMVVTVSLLAVIVSLVILHNTSLAGAIPEEMADLASDPSFQPPSLAIAGLSVEPPRQGSFVSAGTSVGFTFTVKHTGETFADVFDIEINSDWPTELFYSDGTTPLTDSNNDGKIDTGLLSPGQSTLLLARITAPLSAAMGDSNRSWLSISSANDPQYEESILFQSAVPSNFFQAFRNQGLIYPSFLLAQKDYYRSHQIETSEGGGTDIAVAETDSGYIYVWSFQRLQGNLYVTEIFSLLLDKQGTPISAIAKISDHSNALRPTHDVNPVVAVDSPGNIGVSWQRKQFDQDSKVNNNLFFRKLNQDGQPGSDETNITNNTHWDFEGTIGFQDYGSLRVAPMAMSGFFTVWEKGQQESEGVIQDIIFATLTASGSVGISPTNLTDDSPGGSGNVAPAVAGLSSNRTLVSWIRRETDNDDLLVAVLDAQGAVVHGPEDISEDEQVTDWWNFDAVELSNGSILLAWQAWGCIEGEYNGRIRFSVLGNNYRRLGKPACLDPEGLAAGGDRGVSLTADGYENGIVTWTDQDPSKRRNLYYSLIDKRGNIVTEPLAVYRTDASVGTISLNTEGYASTTRSFIDGVALFEEPLIFVQKGENAKITILFGNLGTQASGAMTLTATLNDNLVYQSDTAPTVPTVNGNSLTWNISDYDPGAGLAQFNLYTTIPATATVGSTYPITVSINLLLKESSPNNNNDFASVVVSQPIFLPLIAR